MVQAEQKGGSMVILEGALLVVFIVLGVLTVVVLTGISVSREH